VTRLIEAADGGDAKTQFALGRIIQQAAALLRMMPQRYGGFVRRRTKVLPKLSSRSAQRMAWVRALSKTIPKPIGGS
jgi:hypothetical protein